MTRSPGTILLFVTVAIALALSMHGLVLAQAQPQLISVYHAGELPLADPLSPAWDSVPAYPASVTPQAGVTPTLLAATVPSIEVQSLNNGADITFRLVWQDASQDLYATKPDEFRDAAAIQFPVVNVPKEQYLPIICMGAAGELVNIWHWKADWQADIDDGFHDVVDAYPNFWLDAYPFAIGEPPYRLPTDFSSDSARTYLVGWSAGNPFSNPVRVTPVEDLNANGFGTVTSQSRQDVLGRGVWKDGKWYVVFSRLMVGEERDDIQFKTNRAFPVAFAIWDGSDKQVGARKQLSTWTTMLLETERGLTQPREPLSSDQLKGITVTVLSFAAGTGVLILGSRLRPKPPVKARARRKA